MSHTTDTAETTSQTETAFDGVERDPKRKRNPRRDRLKPPAWICGAAIVVVGCFLEQSAELRLALVGIGVVTLLWPATLSSARRTRWQASWGIEPTYRTGLLCGLAVVSLVVSLAGDASWYFGSSKIRVWNVYHYGVGAKYFTELGYSDLYRATLEADENGPDYWKPVKKVRNLETYEVVGRGEIEPFDVRERFSQDRYAEFESDIAALTEHRSARGWRNIFRDRGYNATPFWTVVGRGLTTVFPLDHPATLKALSALDLVLLASTLWLVYRCFGTERAALLLLLLTASPVNDDRFLGGLLQYDWLCAGIAALCLYQRRRPGWAGALFSYAILTRAFPLAFVATAALPLLFSLPMKRRIPRRFVRFALSLTLACAAGLGLSLLNGRGASAWTEWVAAIELHRETHLQGDRRIGLEHYFTQTIGTLQDDVSDSRRLENAEQQHNAYLAAAGLLIIGTLAVARRARVGDAWILGQVPVFTLLVLSRYYHSFLATFALMGRGRTAPLETRIVAALQLMVFGGFSIVEMSGREHHPSYAAVNGLLAVFFAVSLVLGHRLASKQPVFGPQRSHTRGSSSLRADRAKEKPVESPIETVRRSPL